MRGKAVFLRNVPKTFIRKKATRVVSLEQMDFTGGWLISHTTECTKEMKIFKKTVGFDNNFVISVSVIWGRAVGAIFS